MVEPITRADQCRMCIAKGYSRNETAAYLEISSRTLQRHLAAEDTSWTAIIAELEQPSDFIGTTDGDVDDQTLVSPESGRLINLINEVSGLIDLRSLPSAFNQLIVSKITEDSLNDSFSINLSPRFNLLENKVIQRDMFLSAIGGSVAVMGVRGTAKTTHMEDASVYKAGKAFMDKELVQIRIFSGKGKTASKRVVSIGRLLHKSGIPKQYFLKENSEEIVIGIRTDKRNDVWVQITSHNLTMADVNSYRGDIVWLDEANQIDRAFMNNIIGLFSGRPDIQLWITGNALQSTGGMFETLMTNDDPEFKEQLESLLGLEFFALEEHDIYWTEDKDKEAIRILLEYLGTEGAVAEQMTNEFVSMDGVRYPSAAVNDAFKPYDKPLEQQLDDVFVFIDWGGEHDTAIIVGGFMDQTFYMLEDAIYKQHPKPDWLESVFLRLTTEYESLKKVIWEKSPLGEYGRNHIKSKFGHLEFHGKVFTHHKPEYIANMYVWLNDRDLHLMGKKLKRQIKNFTNNKKDDDGHDALILGLYNARPKRIRNAPDPLEFVFT